jgi:DAACS family dicarboxylate/amino acid:cation (Na+ or H+) symporter
VKQHTKLLLGLLSGIGLGLLLHPFQDQPTLITLNENLFYPIGQIFLRMIFMVVVPLVVSALILGVLELGQGEGLGRIAGKTLAFTLVASSASVIIGVTLVNILKPGVGFQLNPEMLKSHSAQVAGIQKNASAASTFGQAIVDLIPKNPIDSATKALTGEMLPLMIFALIFGLALSQVKKNGERDVSQFIAWIEQLFAVSMQVIEFAMKLAPIGVFAIVFGTIFKHGSGILGSLVSFVGVVLLGIAVQKF